MTSEGSDEISSDQDAILAGSQDRDGRFGSKVGQIGPKGYKSGAFSDQISVQLVR